jgi:hypothetical protein
MEWLGCMTEWRKGLDALAPPRVCGLRRRTLLARLAGTARHDTLLKCVVAASGTLSSGYDFRAPARLSSQRFLAASLMAFLPAALNIRSRFVGLAADADAVGAEAALTLAHLAF